MLECVEDCRLDVLYDLIDKYWQLKSDSESDIKKYMKYLEIMDFKYKYVGENNHIFHGGIEKYINSFGVINSNLYTDKALDSYFNDIRYVFIKIEEIEHDVQNLCNLDYCTKIILYMNYKFDINIKYEYDCKLISLIIKEGCKSVVYNEGETLFKEITPGEYNKESLTFNILKSNVDVVKIKNNEGFVETISVRNFEKRYGDLKWFVVKELYENDNKFINTYDDVTKRTLEVIRPFISLRGIPIVRYVNKCSLRNATGEYFCRTIMVKNSPEYGSEEMNLIHEIGHFIHDIIFDDRQIRFPTKGKGNYAKKNYFENFAECFTDLIYYRNVNDKTKKMFKLLQEVI